MRVTRVAAIVVPAGGEPLDILPDILEGPDQRFAGASFGPFGEAQAQLLVREEPGILHSVVNLRGVVHDESQAVLFRAERVGAVVVVVDDLSYQHHIVAVHDAAVLEEEVEHRHRDMAAAAFHHRLRGRHTALVVAAGGAAQDIVGVEHGQRGIDDRRGLADAVVSLDERVLRPVDQVQVDGPSERMLHQHRVQKRDESVHLPFLPFTAMSS